MDPPPCSLCIMTVNLCFLEEERLMKISLQRPRSRLVFWLDSRDLAGKWWSLFHLFSQLPFFDSAKMRGLIKIDPSPFFYRF
jgi:hypothetical protein